MKKNNKLFNSMILAVGILFAAAPKYVHADYSAIFPLASKCATYVEANRVNPLMA